MGNSYRYTYQGKNFQITSLGSDGKNGGKGRAKDIVCSYEKFTD
ncbi:type II secretion system protein GspG [Candidatus Uabimicrobium sp. HlEnr_7]